MQVGVLLQVLSSHNSGLGWAGRRTSTAFCDELRDFTTRAPAHILAKGCNVLSPDCSVRIEFKSMRRNAAPMKGARVAKYCTVEVGAGAGFWVSYSCVGERLSDVATTKRLAKEVSDEIASCLDASLAHKFVGGDVSVATFTSGGVFINIGLPSDLDYRDQRELATTSSVSLVPYARPSTELFPAVSMSIHVGVQFGAQPQQK